MLLKKAEDLNLKKDGIELFSGEFWAGSKAKELGLIDELGDASQILKEKFGEDVVIKKFEKPKGWFSKKFSSSSKSSGPVGNYFGGKIYLAKIWLLKKKSKT